MGKRKKQREEEEEGRYFISLLTNNHDYPLNFLFFFLLLFFISSSSPLIHHRLSTRQMHSRLNYFSPLPPSSSFPLPCLLFYLSLFLPSSIPLPSHLCFIFAITTTICHPFLFSFLYLSSFIFTLPSLLFFFSLIHHIPFLLPSLCPSFPIFLIFLYYPPFPPLSFSAFPHSPSLRLLLTPGCVCLAGFLIGEHGTLSLTCP